MHKTLGFLCVASYIVRFSMWKDDCGFSRYPQFTIPTLILHLLLSVSSMIFKIPTKRIMGSGYRIWPEYRLHSITFACRSLLTMALYHYELVNNLPPNYYASYAMPILGMLAADIASWSVGNNKSPTIRGWALPPWVKFLFSSAQLYANAFFLLGSRRFSGVFYSVMVIQGNVSLSHDTPSQEHCVV